jgi:PAS domain S-box-containing protein
VVADVRASSVSEHGETLSVLSLRDLTDRLAFEEREQELIRRFDQATDAANIGVWELNTGTLKAEWSDRACEIFGVDPEQFRGTAEEWRKVPHPEDARKVDAVIADAVKTQAPFETEFRILQPSGEERIVRVAGCAEEAQGDPETLILAGVCTDVTEARRLEQREKDLLRRFGQATNAANIGIWEYLPSSDELYWSDQIFEMFGTSRESFAGTSTDFERAVHAEDLAKVKEAMEGGLASREDFEAEFRVVRPDGSVRHVKSLASIDDTDAKKPRVVGVTLDVTEQRRLERREKELIQRFESATNAAGIGVWEWDVDTGSLSWSSQMYAIYGIPVECRRNLQRLAKSASSRRCRARAARTDRSR